MLARQMPALAVGRKEPARLRERRRVLRQQAAPGGQRRPGAWVERHEPLPPAFATDREQGIAGERGGFRQ